MRILGREKEIKILQRLLSSKQAEFLTLHGRRRIGKTFLIREFYQNKNCIYFEVTGLKEGKKSEQLEIFRKALAQKFYPNVHLAPFKNWMEALEQLTHALEENINKRMVIFFDELPWLATKKSGLLPAIDHFWNTRWSKINKLVFIACGSAASWMLENLIYAKGGLHNRITEKIALQPFTLFEVSNFLAKNRIKYTRNQILQLYMVMGGIPYYLKWVQRELSVAQNINQICFNPNGGLFNEFEVLFSSLFDESHFHLDIIKYIAKSRKGVSRDEIIKNVSHASSGGVLTKRLQELESAGFISSFVPYGNLGKEIYFRVIDEYTLFYLNWIQPAKRKLKLLRGETPYWENVLNMPAYNSWSGNAFEALCIKHIDFILKALKLESLAIGASSWRYKPKNHVANDQGVQIDLLIERKDAVINICEIKYSNKKFVIEKQYADNLRKKLQIFHEKTKTTSQLILTFISANGMKRNHYYHDLVTNDIDINCFFVP
jgi:AAA+ ATPase superfamily predicted ATPase